MGEMTGGQANPVVHFLLSNWLSIIFGVIGLAGTAYGYLSWQSGKRQKQIYGYLFELAEKNIAKNITDQELAETRKAIAEASNRIEALQQRIRRDIPMAARRAVLVDRLRNQTEILHQHYESVLSLQTQLKATGAPVDMPEELIRAIQQHIEPEYFIRKRRSGLKTSLSILTAGAAVASAAVPYPAGRLISLGLLVIAVPVLFALVKDAIREYAKRDPAAIGRWLVGIGIAGGAVAFAFGAGFLVLAGVIPSSTEVTAPFGISLLVISSCVILFSMRRRTQFRRALNKTKSGSREAPSPGQGEQG